MSRISKMYYERTLENIQTRLITINTKEKAKKYQAEITTLKMIIVLISNLLETEK